MSDEQSNSPNSRAPVQLKVRGGAAHKGSFGRVLLVGGSRGMSGSIAMSTIAAMKTGSGLVSAAVPDRCLETVASFHPAAMTIPLSDDSRGRFSLAASGEIAPLLDSIDAIGVGPGMTTDPGSLRIVERLLQFDHKARVFDADALNALTMLGWRDLIPGSFKNATETSQSIVLTPHPGELQRLVGVSADDREGQIDAASKLAAQTGVVIVVKGGPTVVVNREHRYTNTTGNPGMASGGSGDVLTGVITSLLGQGLSGWDASRLGVWVHGHAGDLAAQKYGQAGMTAVEILEFLPLAVKSIESENSES